MIYSRAYSPNIKQWGRRVHVIRGLVFVHKGKGRTVAARALCGSQPRGNSYWRLTMGAAPEEALAKDGYVCVKCRELGQGELPIIREVGGGYVRLKQ